MESNRTNSPRVKASECLQPAKIDLEIVVGCDMNPELCNTRGATCCCSVKKSMSRGKSAVTHSCIRMTKSIVSKNLLKSLNADSTSSSVQARTSANTFLNTAANNADLFLPAWSYLPVLAFSQCTTLDEPRNSERRCNTDSAFAS